MGVGAENQPPLAVPQRLGHCGDEQISLFPPVLPDGIAADLPLICDPEAVDDLLAHCSRPCNWETMAIR
ncbi:MAG: hypothetical protein DDG58_13625 [Ardenticatenia bacterium]|nr:MAG: hypothetical protein DDG58_13625 [Ardenticatenia bacterium]